MTEVVVDEQTRRLGERIRSIRQRRRLSLRQLAELCGSSASFLSQLERGRSGATVSTLIQIARALNVTLSAFFDDEPVRLARVVTRDDRPTLHTAPGLRKTLLSQKPLDSIEAYVGELEPGGSTGDEPYTHGDSHELLLVLKGQVTALLDGQSYPMTEGDSLEYRSSTPHGVINTGDGPAEVLWVIAPPTSTDSDL